MRRIWLGHSEGARTGCVDHSHDTFNLINLPKLEPLGSPRLVYLECNPTGEKYMEEELFKAAWNSQDVQGENLGSSSSVILQL